jgi:hypothetical protein
VFEGVRLHVVGEGEERAEVADEILTSSLDGGEKSSIDGLLDLNALGVDLNLLVSGEELVGALGLSDGSEELVINRLSSLEGSLGELDLGGGGDNEGLVNAGEGATVELVRAGNEELAGRDLLEEDNALALLSTGKNNKNSTGGDGLAEGSLHGVVGLGADSLADLSKRTLGLSNLGLLSSGKLDHSLDLN